MKYVLPAMIGLVFLFVRATVSDQEPSTKEQLGELLFADPILSSNKTISCASCHKPTYAFADTSAVSLGVGGKKGVRNTPSAMNLSLQSIFFWDGRAATLEEQALAPISNPDEMNLPIDQAINRLKKHDKYNRYFKKIFNSEPTSENLADALASFEKTLETSDSPFDIWKFYDDSNAVSNSVKKGFEVFNGKGKCVQCHFGSNFTLNQFRNIGLFDGKKLNDSGRMVISGNKEDIGKFKTIGLRNVAITPPYMHNGIFKTLREVIDFYNDPEKIVPNGINRDTVLAKPLGLSEEEKNNLEAFLNALTDKRFAATTEKDTLRLNNRE